MKKYLYLISLLFSATLLAHPADTSSYLAITYEVYYAGEKIPFVYYWLLYTGPEKMDSKACPVLISCWPEENYQKFLDNHYTNSDTLTFWVGVDDANGLPRSALYPYVNPTYITSFLEVIDQHKLLVQEQVVKNRYSWKGVKPLKYRVKVYLTPIQAVMGQVINDQDNYSVPVYYPKSEAVYDSTFWEEDESLKWSNYLRIPFMVLSGCETAPDFVFPRIFFKGTM